MKDKLRADVWDLLKKNISKAQLAGYMTANVVGLAVVLIGVIFFADSQHGQDNEDAYFSRDYIVISKKVEGLGFAPLNFDDEDIEQIQKQPWVKKIGPFTSSRFAVNGSVSMGGQGLSSYLFCEAVPDEFFDVKPDGWSFDPQSEDRHVPIIISRDYLTLYNYGFAIPQHLPQVSEDLISSIPITLRLTGDNNEPEIFEANIVGFSSRLNTIAVPQTFMDWANDHFAPGVESQPSRLIVEIDRMHAASADEFLIKHDYEVAGDNDGKGNISTFLAVVSSVVTTNGIVICLLALFILVLSIFLMLQKSKTTLRNIMLLGYSPDELSMYYNIIVVSANIVISIVALTVALIARGLWSGSLSEIGLGGASLWPMFITLLVYLVAVTALDLYVIRSHMAKIWKG